MSTTKSGEMNKEDKYEIMGGETEKVSLVNEATGVPIILRRFHFAVPPTAEKWPTKRELADLHKPAVEQFLWKDELVLVQDLRIIIDKDKKGFDIFATCQPRRGAELREKPKTLQEVIKKHDTRRDKGEAVS